MVLPVYGWRLQHWFGQCLFDTIIRSYPTIDEDSHFNDNSTTTTTTIDDDYDGRPRPKLKTDVTTENNRSTEYIPISIWKWWNGGDREKN